MSVSVSETIGKLLLEGYKMLADSCDVCCTVLMQDRRGRVICVQCESLSMANAGQPDMNEEMTSTNKISNGGNRGQESRNAPNNSANNNSIAVARSEAASSLISCQEVLETEIKKATGALHLLSQHRDHDIQAKLTYVKYIRECAETISSLKGVKKTQ